MNRRDFIKRIVSAAAPVNINGALAGDFFTSLTEEGDVPEFGQHVIRWSDACLLLDGIGELFEAKNISNGIGAYLSRDPGKREAYLEWLEDIVADYGMAGAVLERVGGDEKAFYEPADCSQADWIRVLRGFHLSFETFRRQRAGELNIAEPHISLSDEIHYRKPVTPAQKQFDGWWKKSAAHIGFDPKNSDHRESFLRYLQSGVESNHALRIAVPHAESLPLEKWDWPHLRPLLHRGLQEWKRRLIGGIPGTPENRTIVNQIDRDVERLLTLAEENYAVSSGKTRTPAITPEEWEEWVHNERPWTQRLTRDWEIRER